MNLVKIGANAPTFTFHQQTNLRAAIFNCLQLGRVDQHYMYLRAVLFILSGEKCGLKRSHLRSVFVRLFTG